MPSEPEPNPRGSVLGKVFPIQSLPGWLNKSLVVPSGYQGIVIDAGGGMRTFPPGRHSVINAWQRLGGQSMGLRAAILAAQSPAILIETSYLLSGDGKLVDASFLVNVVIADPKRLLDSPCVTEECDLILPVSAVEVQKALQPVILHYSASDLCGGIRIPGFLEEIQSRLGALLANSGLAIKNLAFLSIWGSERKVEMAARVQELDEKLTDVDLRRRMAEIETQAQMDEFIQQVQPGLENATSLVSGGTSSDQPTQTGLGENIRTWLKLKNSPKSDKRRSIDPVLPKETAKTTAKSVSPHLWRSTINIIIVVFIAELLLSTLFVLLTQDKPRQFRIDWLIPLWSSGLLLIWGSINHLVKEHEKLDLDFWLIQRPTRLERMARSDRQRVDEVVRKQCSQGFEDVLNIFKDLRRRIYDTGDEILALRLKKLENKAAAIQEGVKNPSVGAPPYLSDLKVANNIWQEMLEYDENVLLTLNGLAEKAFLLQTSMAAKLLTPERLDAMELGLDQFSHLFNARAQVIKKPVN